MKVDLEKGILLKKTIFLEKNLISNICARFQYLERYKSYQTWVGRTISGNNPSSETDQLRAKLTTTRYNCQSVVAGGKYWINDNFSSESKESSWCREYQRIYTAKSYYLENVLTFWRTSSSSETMGGSTWRMVWWSKWHDVQMDKAPQLNCNFDRDMNPYMAWTIASRTASFKKNVCLTR